MPRRYSALIFGALWAALVFLTACGGNTRTATPTSEPAAPTPTATPAAPRTLNICLGQEPASLFPLNNPSAVAQSVLAAVYDGPIDTNSYGYQPVILQTLPSLANGDAQVFQKSVYVGDEVVDASGSPVTLVAGTKVRPAGCHDDTCVVVYDGTSAIQMDQMQVTFRMLPNLTWSDGELLTADDSVYAFELASNPSLAGSAYLVDRTQSYEAADDVTIQWWGKPGFIDPTYVTNFWAPLPRHSWGQIPPDQLLDSSEASRSPLGWGPYVIQEWQAGDHITLIKNTRYFRANQGLPRFDTLTFRFISDPETAISDLIAGSCDILDPSVGLDGQVSLLRSMADQDQLQALFTTTPTMEQLALGIAPASYDNGFNEQSDRPGYFDDPRVRQAIAMCLDRQQVVDTVLYGLTTIPTSLAPAGSPFYNPDVKTYSYNLTEANALLEQAGWKDTDNDPTTPRLADGVMNVPNGTPLELSYLTTNATQRLQVSSILADSLAQCGIQVNVENLDQADLYAPGPAGPLFGRNFDLAEFAMGSTGIEPSCEWYASAEVPNATNHWVGTNVSGYNNPDFDSTCQAAQQSLPDQPEHIVAEHQAQSIFAEEVPVIPLYWRVKVAAALPQVCNFSLDPTAQSAMWNIEAFDSGFGCQP